LLLHVSREYIFRVPQQHGHPKPETQMRAASIAVASIILVACGTPPDQQQAAEPASPAALTLADFAGTWETTATLEGVDEPVRSTMTGSTSGDDWTLAFADRPGIPLAVSVQGDSLISESAEYESVLRPGVMVTVRTVAVLQDGDLIGRMVATYRTANGEQLVPGTSRGVRVR
jgi:hypothetical protein